MHRLFVETLKDYQMIPHDMAESYWLYLNYGLYPGSFGTFVLTNNFSSAVNCAHRSLSADTFRDLANWISDYFPRTCRGSDENMVKWKALTDDQRRDILIEYRLRPSVIDILSGKETR